MENTDYNQLYEIELALIDMGYDRDYVETLTNNQLKNLYYEDIYLD